MASRLRLQYGAFQIEYEGSDEFLKAELPKLLEHVAKLVPAVAAARDPGQTPGLETVRF